MARYKKLHPNDFSDDRKKAMEELIGPVPEVILMNKVEKVKSCYMRGLRDFDEIAKISGAAMSTVKGYYYKLKKQGLIK